MFIAHLKDAGTADTTNKTLKRITRLSKITLGSEVPEKKEIS